SESPSFASLVRASPTHPSGVISIVIPNLFGTHFSARAEQSVRGQPPRTDLKPCRERCAGPPGPSGLRNGSRNKFGMTWVEDDEVGTMTRWPRRGIPRLQSLRQARHRYVPISIISQTGSAPKLKP